jgi:hypothetical protein
MALRKSCTSDQDMMFAVEGVYVRCAANVRDESAAAPGTVKVGRPLFAPKATSADAERRCC